jgi:molybdopterin/thiamine biosynthesis adenylyltransferase/ubiquitin-protein ligase
MMWVLNNPSRFLHERAELDHLESEVDWLTTVWRFVGEGVVEVDLDMVIHGRNYAGRMTYPDVFPNSLPYIRPRDDSERWTVHQYGAGGSLCLQWRADNWLPQVTGADIVRSAFELLSTEQHPETPGVVPSAHCLTKGQAMRSEEYRFVATKGLLDALSSLPHQSRSTLKTHTILNTTATVAFVSEISATEGAALMISDLPFGISKYSPLFAYKGDGLVFKSEAVVTSSPIASVDNLLTLLSGAGLDSSNILVKDEVAGKFKERVVVLLGQELASLRAFLIDSGEQPVLREYKVILPSNSEIRLPEEYEQLSKVRVGIVGLGSIGSKVALSLARSGVRKYLLVDDDYLIPGNLVRHDLSWAFVGVHKVNAVRDALRLVAAGMDVDVRIHRIAGQESALSAAAALKDLANCDLLIDATASPEVFLHMAAISKANKKTLCWGELFAGGYGGLIARARPDIDPNPLAVRSAIYSFLSTLPPAPFQQAGGYDVEHEQPFIAYDSDVGQIATAMTRLSIDAALHRNPSQFPYPVYLIGLRREWIFEQPFDIRPVEAQGDGWEDTDMPVTEEDRLAALKVLMEILEEKKHAEPDSPA